MRTRGLLILALVLLAANVGWWLLHGSGDAPWQRTPTPAVSAEAPLPSSPDPPAAFAPGPGSAAARLGAGSLAV